MGEVLHDRGEGPDREFQVLVVEDEVLIALALEAMLNELGYKVIGPVPGVAKAIEALDACAPDAAVLDVNVGGERVTPVAEALRARELPYVLLTGYRGRELEEPALQAAPRLDKPVLRDRLAGALTTMLAEKTGRPN
jgi:CheY-like chemotaxis protein